MPTCLLGGHIDHSGTFTTQKRLQLLIVYKKWKQGHFVITSYSIHYTKLYDTYLSKFGIKLPSTTEQMSHLGKKVSQNNLNPGDLVFFKTGLFSRHVGIYLDKRKFLHASTSVGVTISSLDNHYWKKNYWKSVRISTNLR